MPTKKTKSPSKKVFRDVVAKALQDKTYAKKLKAIAVKAKKGDKHALQQLMKSFHLTPHQLKQVSTTLHPKTNNAGITITIPITLTATFLLSCFPRSWDICSVADGK